MQVNGRDCTDIGKVAELSKQSSRVVELRHFVWRRHDISRKCNVFVRHFIDIQTSVQNSEHPAFNLMNWNWDLRVPEITLTQPLKNVPEGFVYKGWNYGEHVPVSPAPKPTLDGPIMPLDLQYNISTVIAEVPLPSAPAGHTMMQTYYLYDINHVFRMDEKAPISGLTKNADGTVGTSEPDLLENRRVGYRNHTFDKRSYAATPILDLEPANSSNTTNVTAAPLTPAQLFANLSAIAEANATKPISAEPTETQKNSGFVPAPKPPVPVKRKVKSGRNLPVGEAESTWSTPFNSPPEPYVPLYKGKMKPSRIRVF